MIKKKSEKNQKQKKKSGRMRFTDLLDMDTDLKLDEISDADANLKFHGIPDEDNDTEFDEISDADANLKFHGMPEDTDPEFDEISDADANLKFHGMPDEDTDSELDEISDGNTGKKSRKNSKKKGKWYRHKRKKDDKRLIRIEELEELMGELGEDVNPETIVSMYMPRRRARRFGAALLRLDKLYLYLLGAILMVAVLFIVAFMQEKMGNFTINLNRLELYRKGIAIAEDGDFTDPTARLTANTVQDATNITLDDLPDDIDDIEGDHNGKNYMAYTYYVRNAGKEDVGYNAVITLDSCAKGAEEAVRVAVWKNGKRTVYAEPAMDGKEENGCVNFIDHETVCSYTEEEFLVGNVDKYTIVIWMEGEDPECVDSIVGGSVEFSMKIDAISEDDTSLLVKFVQDIVDTLKDNKAIGAAGTKAPNYYEGGEVTWKNRRNQ